MYLDMYMEADERSLWKIEKSINKTITTKPTALYFNLIAQISAFYLSSFLALFFFLPGPLI